MARQKGRPRQPARIRFDAGQAAQETQGRQLPCQQRCVHGTIVPGTGRFARQVEARANRLGIA